jgi:hypothetical protein
MKIYINNKDLSKIDIEFETTYKQSLLYTTDGIFHHKKDIHKIEYTETKIEETHYKNNHFYIDNSKIIYTDIIYNIPFLHLYCQEFTYKKNIGDGIYFIKYSYFDQNVYYFETNCNSNCIDDAIFDKIITFLSSN